MLTIPSKDAVEGEEDEEDEEEEEEETGAGVAMSGQQALGQQAALSSVHSSLNSARTSPTSVGAPLKHDRSLMIDLSVYALPRLGRAAEGGKVKTVRQWAPRTEFGSTAQV
jgi:casein kinase II subunit beta